MQGGGATGRHGAPYAPFKIDSPRAPPCRAPPQVRHSSLRLLSAHADVPAFLGPLSALRGFTGVPAHSPTLHDPFTCKPTPSQTHQCTWACMCANPFSYSSGGATPYMYRPNWQFAVFCKRKQAPANVGHNSRSKEPIGPKLHQSKERVILSRSRTLAELRVAFWRGSEQDGPPQAKKLVNYRFFAKIA